MLQIKSIRHDKGTMWFEERGASHDSHTLVLSTYGKCVYWIGEDKVIVEKGHFLLIPSGVPYYGKCIPTLFHEKYAFEFSVTGMGIVPLLPLLTKQDYICWKTGKYDMLLSLIRGLYVQWSERQPYSETMCLALLLETLAHCNREIDAKRRIPAAQQLVDAMKSYIHNHYREKVTKDELGTMIERSPNYAATLFRKVTGQTISDYVHALRVKTAISMLQQSELTAGEISEFLGYCDPSFFHKMFKKITGQSPLAFAKEHL